MNSNHYKSVIEYSAIGYAYNTIIRDGSGSPSGYAVIDANRAFGEIAGMKLPDILGKNILELLADPGSSGLDSLGLYARVAENMGKESTEVYSSVNERWYQVDVFSEEKDFFTTLFTDITACKTRKIDNEELLLLSRALLDTKAEPVDYELMTKKLCLISGAEFGVFNLYSDDNLKFNNVAVYGNSELVNKAYKLLGRPLTGMEWKVSDLRLNEIREGHLIRFNDIAQLAEGVLPKSVCNAISLALNLGPVYVIEISAHGKNLGDFVIFFRKGSDLINRASATAFANMVGISINRRKDGERIEKSEENLRNFFNAGIDMHWVLDEKGNIIAVNETVVKRLGFSEQELIGLPVLDVHPEGQREDALRIITAMLRGEDVGCFIPVVNKSGEHIPVETYVVTGGWSGKPALFGISRDLSALKSSEEKFNKAFNSSPNIMGLSDLETGVFVEVNKAFYDNLGYTPEEVIGKRSTEILNFSKSLRESLLERLKKDGYIKNTEVIINNKKGEPLTLLLSGEIIRTQNQAYNLTVALDITERKKAEAAWHKANELLAQTGMLAKVGAWEVDFVTNKLTWSDVTKKLMSVPPDYEPVLEDVLRFYKEGDSRERIYNLIEKTRLTGEAFDGEFIAIDFIGNEHWIRNTVKAIMEDGMCVRIVGAFQDITDQKAAEKKLRKSEADLKAIIENTLENIWSVNTSYQIEYVNEVFSQAFKATFGVELKAGMNIVDALPEGLRNTWKERYDKAFGNEHFVFNDRIEVGDQEIYIEVSSNPIIVDGKVVGAAMYGRDVTGKMLAQIQLQNQADLRKLLVELSSGFINLPSAMVEPVVFNSLKRIGEFVGADRAYVFSYDFEKNTASNTIEWCREGISMQIDSLQNVPLEAFSGWVDYHKTGRSVKVRNVTDVTDEAMKLLMESQDIKSLLTIPLMLQDKCRGFVGFDSVTGYHNYNDYEEQLLQVYAQTLVNVTERLENEKKMIEAKEKAEESDRLKSAFLANMSHEIRTPMNGILGFLDLLRAPELTQENKNNYIDIVTQSGQRLLGTLNDIIEISKIEAGEMEVHPSDVDIPELLMFFHGFFKPQTDTRQLKFSVKPDRRHPFIRTDRTKIESMLSNLLRNAVKFTDKGQIEFGNYVDGTNMVFYVSDTGNGIDPSRHKLIFERFVQGDMSISRPYEGSGLGLSIVKAYSGMLGGEVWVESEPGKGSKFFFTIPFIIASGDRKKKEPERTGDAISENKLNILVVEDDPSSYLYLEKILGSENISIVHVVDGEESVAAVKGSNNFDLVLMDIKIPGISGIEATKRIRQFNTGIPIIAQTAYAFPSDREMALEAGCTDFISKPVSKQELLKLIKLHTGSRN